MELATVKGFIHFHFDYVEFLFPASSHILSREDIVKMVLQ